MSPPVMAGAAVLTYSTERTGRQPDDAIAGPASQDWGAPGWAPAGVTPYLYPSLGRFRVLLNRRRRSPLWGRPGLGRVSKLVPMFWLSWWLMEFAILDVAATVLLLAGLLAVMIRKAVL